jgi:multidrug efflux pump subunit AcrB
MLAYLLQRPLAVLTIFVALAITGILAFLRMPTALMPGIEVPRLRVTVQYPQGSPQFIEQSILQPLRISLSSIYGLDQLESTSATGLGQIDILLAYGTNAKLAYLEVNEKIDQAMPILPTDLARPVVLANNPTDIPVVRLQVMAPGYSKLDQTDLARFVIRRRLEQIPGVSLVEVNGTVDKLIRIVPDDQRMASLGLRHEDIVNAVRAANISLRQIEVRDGIYSFGITFNSILHTAEGVGDIEVAVRGTRIPLRELATLQVDYSRQSGLHLYQGQEAIVFAVHLRAKAKASEVLKELQATVNDLEELYPGVSFTLTQDQGKLLSVTINQLTGSLIAGSLVAFLILFVFSGEWRSPVLIGVLMPVSLVITFLIMHVAGLTLNLVTLAGLILGIGILVDNGIILIDNIQSKVPDMGIRQACITGVVEVVPAMVSSLLTTLCVFMPLLFLGGLSGVLFRDQILTLGIVLTVSLLVSFVLLPVLFSRLVKSHPGSQGRVFEKVLQGYHASKGLTSRILVSLLIVLVVGVLSVHFIPRQNLPDIRTADLELLVHWSDPVSPETNAVRIRELLDGLPYLKEWEAEIGINSVLEEGLNVPFQARVYARFESPEKAQQAADQLSARFDERFPGTMLSVTRPKNPYDQLFRQSSVYARIKLRASGAGAISVESIPDDIRQSTKTGHGFQCQEALELALQDNRLERYGLTRSAVVDRVAMHLNDQRVTMVNRLNEALPIAIMGTGEMPGLDQVFIFSPDSTAYPLAQLIELKPAYEPKFLTADLAGPYQDLIVESNDGSFARVMNRIDSLAAAQGWIVGVDGQVREQGRNFTVMALSIALSILLLYVILVAQFESFRSPVVILSELPFSLAGCLLALWLTGNGLNISSLMGILISLGIIVNDSILKLDTILKLERGGMAREEAVALAGTLRLKPILMTTLTTIIALMPVFFTSGFGGGLQVPLVTALIGGLTVGTLCSVYLMPWVYVRMGS